MFFVAASVALLAVQLSICTALPRASEDSDPDTDSSGTFEDSPTETPSATQRDSTPASELPREDTKSAPTSQLEGRFAPHNQEDPLFHPTTSSPLLPCDSCGGDSKSVCHFRSLSR